MSDYKLLSDGGVLHVPTGMSIPADPANRHYRAYLEWKQAGGVAEPADPEPEPSQMPSDAERIAALEQAVVDLALEGML
jgi:hypothetical protein